MPGRRFESVQEPGLAIVHCQLRCTPGIWQITRDVRRCNSSAKIGLDTLKNDLVELLDFTKSCRHRPLQSRKLRQTLRDDIGIARTDAGNQRDPRIACSVNSFAISAEHR